MDYKEFLQNKRFVLESSGFDIDKSELNPMIMKTNFYVLGIAEITKQMAEIIKKTIDVHISEKTEINVNIFQIIILNTVIFIIKKMKINLFL